MDLSNLAYWYPKLQAEGLPMPSTILVHADEQVLTDIRRVFDGTSMTSAVDDFFHVLAEAGEELGYPLFLRSGHTAGKHNWRHTCYVARARELRGHIIALVEYSDIISLGQFSCEWWAAREYLPLTPLVTAPLFSDMPICREFRLFVVDGTVKCIHPYWTVRTLEQGGVENPDKVYQELAHLKDERYLRELAGCAGAALGGAWSVDILDTRRGWSIIDMAEAHKSYHMSGCIHSFD